MKLYRGQRYGQAAGRWWTTDKEEAQNFAHSRGPGAWVVLAFEADGRKLAPYLFNRHNGRATYRIPPDVLRIHTMAVRIVDGFLSLL